MDDSARLIAIPKSNGSAHLASLLIMCGGFWAVFAAYNGTQSIQTSLIAGKLGYWSIASVYAGFCFGSLLIAPAAVKFLNPKYSMLLGATTYAGFMAANLYPTYQTLIPTAVILGLGASMLWSGEGAYLTRCAANYAIKRSQPVNSVMGLFNGIFFAIFQFSQLTGNMIVAIVLFESDNEKLAANKLLFYIFLGVAALGFFILCGVRNESMPSSLKIEDNDSVPVKIFKVFVQWKDPRMLLLIPCIIYSGLEMGFIFGDYTSFLVTDTIGSKYVGFVVGAFGLIDGCFSLIFGKLADKNKLLVVAFGFISQLSFYIFWVIFLTYNDREYIKDHPWILFGGVAVFAVGDAVWNTFPSTMMSVFFTSETEAAFSNLKLWQSIGFVLAFTWGPLFEFKLKIYILIGTIIFATLSIVILDRFFASLKPLPKSSSINSA